MRAAAAAAATAAAPAAAVARTHHVARLFASTATSTMRRIVDNDDEDDDDKLQRRLPTATAAADYNRRWLGRSRVESGRHSPHLLTFSPLCTPAGASASRQLGDAIALRVVVVARRPRRQVTAERRPRDGRALLIDSLACAGASVRKHIRRAPTAGGASHADRRRSLRSRGEKRRRRYRRRRRHHHRRRRRRHRRRDHRCHRYRAADRPPQPLDA